MAADLRSYALVTAAYWGFTVTDGALRMLVLLHFHLLGYTPFEIALLFLLYEVCGILTNLFGGWLGARFGLKSTLFSGLAIQIAALIMLARLDPNWVVWLSVVYVMAAQALSGVAKDLTKMSSKSAVKLVIPNEAQSALFRWVAVLTGSKNALKGVGFFVGGLLLSTIGFANGLYAMAGALALVLAGSVLFLKGDMGRAREKVAFSRILSKTPEINRLSAARVFLFAARDVWFVVGLPLFLAESLGWDFAAIGAFLALWVIGYGLVQGAAPLLFRGRAPGGRAAAVGAFALALLVGALALAVDAEWHVQEAVVSGLLLFGVVFAVNSAVHSYLILAYSDSDKVALNVGFYYMANACGRLMGTLLSGLLYQGFGLAGCLAGAAVLVTAAAGVSLLLPRDTRTAAARAGSL